MISQTWLQWALTACFGATGLWTIIRLVLDHGVVTRVGHGLHALMSAAMALMVWPWGVSLAPSAQAVFFVLATGWFGALAVGQARVGRRDRHAAWHMAYHAIMMAAMAWMLLAMLPMTAPAAGHEHHHAMPAWSALIGVALLVAMLVGAATFAVDAFAGGVRGGNDCGVDVTAHPAGRENLNHALMSLGMAVMIVPMIAA